MDVTAVRRKLLTRSQLEHSGVGGRAVERALAAGGLRRVHRGNYVASEVWRAAYPEERHLLRVLAAAAGMRGSDAVVSHVSAAVLWNLPLYNLEPKRVHVSGAGLQGLVRSDGAVARHAIAVAADDRVVIDGIECTSLERTVFDVIRHVSEETGLAIADAAMRLQAMDGDTRTYDEGTAEQSRSRLWRRLGAAAGARGIRRARFIAATADGRAESPGESVSRLLLLRIGFERMRLQVPVPGPSGHDYEVDFGLDDAGAWGEFDGTGKYTDPAMMRGVGYAELAREKEREDWIRATTGRPFARWGTPHIRDEATLARRLQAFHIMPPGHR